MTLLNVSMGVASSRRFRGYNFHVAPRFFEKKLVQLCSKIRLVRWDVDYHRLN
jgi:hypothetical protein